MIKRARGHFLGHPQPARVEEQLAIRLLVAPLVRRPALDVAPLGGIERDPQLLRHGAPARIAWAPDNLGRSCRRIQVELGHRVGPGVVVHGAADLVGPHHVQNLVAIRRLVIPDAAHPVVRGGAKHRQPARAQPVTVARPEVVLPLRQGDAGVDVPAPRELAGDGLLATLRRLPGVVRAAKPLLARVLHRGGKRAIAVFDDRAGQFRILGHQGGENPHIGVPEDMPLIDAAGEPHRRHAVGAPLAHARQEVVAKGVHHLLRGRVTLDDDVARPQPLPRLGVLAEDGVEARAGGRFGALARCRLRIGRVAHRADPHIPRQHPALPGCKLDFARKRGRGAIGLTIHQGNRAAFGRGHRIQRDAGLPGRRQRHLNHAQMRIMPRREEGDLHLGPRLAAPDVARHQDATAQIKALLVGAGLGGGDALAVNAEFRRRPCRTRGKALVHIIPGDERRKLLLAVESQTLLRGVHPQVAIAQIGARLSKLLYGEQPGVL